MTKGPQFCSYCSVAVAAAAFAVAAAVVADVRRPVHAHDYAKAPHTQCRGNSTQVCIHARRSIILMLIVHESMLLAALVPTAHS